MDGSGFAEAEELGGVGGGDGELDEGAGTDEVGEKGPVSAGDVGCLLEVIALARGSLETEIEIAAGKGGELQRGDWRRCWRNDDSEYCAQGIEKAAVELNSSINIAVAGAKERAARFRAFNEIVDYCKLAIAGNPK